MSLYKNIIWDYFKIILPGWYIWKPRQINILLFWMSQNEKDFFAKLQFMSQVVRLYEDPHIQQVALSHVPVEELKEKAKEACEKSKEGGQDGVDEKDCFLLEVLRWFGMHKQFVYFLFLLNHSLMVWTQELCMSWAVEFDYLSDRRETRCIIIWAMWKEKQQ